MTDTTQTVAREVGWHVLLAYWLAQFSAWLGLLTPVYITIALKLSLITSEVDKAKWLGFTLGVGGVIAMLASPVWGTLSDRTRSRFGRRRPWIAAGAVSLLAGLVVMALATDPMTFALGWFICQIGSNAGQAALNAVMSDVIPERQRGLMSALMGASVTAAMVGGVYMTRYTQGSSLAMFLVPWLATPPALAFFFAVVPDRAVEAPTQPAIALRGLFGRIGLGALRHRDFAWAFCSRFLVLFGASFSTAYQVYYLTDHLKVARGEVAEFMVLSTSLMGVMTFVISCAGGWLSDHLRRRKPFVAGAALMLATGLIGAAFAQNFGQFLVAAALISLGQGLYNAVDIALCIDVLPDREKAARDLGVLQIANSLPQSLAPILAPALLLISVGGSSGPNYPLLFVFAGAVALMGGLAVSRIRKSR